MKIKANAGKDFGRLEEGSYVSRVVQIVGLGEHLRDDRYPEKGDCDKLLITCEYPTELIEIKGEMKPRFQSKQENMFLTDRSNLYKIILSVNPKFNIKEADEFDLNDILGQPCMTTIGTTSQGNAKITGWSPLMKGLDVPECMSELVMFDFYEPVKEEYDKLANWAKDDIKKASNYEGSEVEKLAVEEGSGEVTKGDSDPF